MNAHIITRNRRSGHLVVATANVDLARQVASHLGATGSEAFAMDGVEMTIFHFSCDNSPTVHAVAEELRRHGFVVTMTGEEEFPETPN